MHATDCRIDVALEEILESRDRVVRRDPAVRVRRQDAVHLGRERPEPGLVRLDLARHRHRQERAAVKRVVEDDDRRSPRGDTRDLDGVLDRLRTRVDEHRPLLPAAARRQLRQPATDIDVRLVRPDHEALVEIAVGLLVHRGDDRGEAVTGVLAGDAAREVEEHAAVDVRHSCAGGALDDEPGGRDPARDIPAAVRVDPFGGALLRHGHPGIFRSRTREVKPEPTQASRTAVERARERRCARVRQAVPRGFDASATI